MTDVYFHCSSNGRLLPRRQVVAVESLTQARDYAACVVRSLLTTPGMEDWRTWILHASDELGDELFIVPFAFVVGKPH